MSHSISVPFGSYGRRIPATNSAVASVHTLPVPQTNSGTPPSPVANTTVPYQNVWFPQQPNLDDFLAEIAPDIDLQWVSPNLISLFSGVNDGVHVELLIEWNFRFIIDVVVLAGGGVLEHVDLGVAVIDEPESAAHIRVHEFARNLIITVLALLGGTNETGGVLPAVAIKTTSHLPAILRLRGSLSGLEPETVVSHIHVLLREETWVPSLPERVVSDPLFVVVPVLDGVDIELVRHSPVLHPLHVAGLLILEIIRKGSVMSSFGGVVLERGNVLVDSHCEWEETVKLK
ncbi:hypothetical protein FGB62_144g03 [Gracilaria domingensis]|nr:hypothetical protein FGB62_144g03 [Gracilaria domingensis]